MKSKLWAPKNDAPPQCLTCARFIVFTEPQKGFHFYSITKFIPRLLFLFSRLNFFYLFHRLPVFVTSLQLILMINYARHNHNSRFKASWTFNNERRFLIMRKHAMEIFINHEVEDLNFPKRHIYEGIIKTNLSRNLLAFLITKTYLSWNHREKIKKRWIAILIESKWRETTNPLKTKQ